MWGSGDGVEWGEGKESVRAIKKERKTGKLAAVYKTSRSPKVATLHSPIVWPRHQCMPTRATQGTVSSTSSISPFFFLSFMLLPRHQEIFCNTSKLYPSSTLPPPPTTPSTPPTTPRHLSLHTPTTHSPLVGLHLAINSLRAS